MAFNSGPRGYNFEMEDQGMKPRGGGNLQKEETFAGWLFGIMFGTAKTIRTRTQHHQWALTNSNVKYETSWIFNREN